MLDYYENMENCKKDIGKIKRFAAKYSFHKIKEITDEMQNSLNIYHQIDRFIQADNKKFLHKIGKHGIVSVFTGSFEDKLVTDNQNISNFLLCQHEDDANEVSKYSVNVLIFGENPSKVVEAINELDQLLEITAKSLGGFLIREESCFKCHIDTFKNMYLEIKWKNTFCDHKSNDEDEKIIHLVKRTGNFKNFKELSLNQSEKSKEFLDGAIKISRTSYKGEFKFRGRVARYKDFDQVVKFLKSDQKMVKFFI